MKPIYSVTELAETLGLSRYQMGRLVKSKGIPTENIGRKRLICFDKLRAKAPNLAAVIEDMMIPPKSQPAPEGPDEDGLLRTTCSVDDIAQMTGLSRDQVDRYLHSSGIAFHRIGKTDLVTLVDLASRTPGLLKSLLIKAQVASARTPRAGATSAAS